MLFFFGEWLIINIFGETYVRGFDALCLIMIGQLINATMGSVGLFLSMCGFEKDTLKAIVLSTVINVYLNLILIPQYGIVGAALASLVSVAVWNIMLVFQVYHRLTLIQGLIGHLNFRVNLD